MNWEPSQFGDKSPYDNSGAGGAFLFAVVALMVIAAFITDGACR